jgi:hypothetical protein
VFSNAGTNSNRELRVVLESAVQRSSTLRGRGFLELGKPASGLFDPVCLDARQAKVGNEFPLVQIDHEALCRGEVRVVDNLADSFEDLARFVVENGSTSA